jgi:hypothetical protein
MDFPRQITEANERAKKLHSSQLKALAARYDRKADRIVIQLDKRLEIAFSPKDAEGLETARPSQLEPIEVSPSGFGIYFPKLDADIYIPALLEGLLGSRNWMASRMGLAGGQSRSVAKANAARTNGQRGGRPKKKTPAVA